MAGRNYAIDKHPQRNEIREAILRGASFRHISSQYGMSANSVMRYAEAELHKDISIYIARQKEKDINSIDGLVERLNYLADICKKMIDRCMVVLSEEGEIDVTSNKRDTHAILKDNISNLRATLETIGKFLGLVKDISVVNNINIDTSKFISHIADIIEDTVTDQQQKEELVRRLYEGV